MVALAMLSISACSSGEQEVVVSSGLHVYQKPAFPESPGNQTVGTVPQGESVIIKRELIVKELMVYEVEYLSPDGKVLRGYVPSGREGGSIIEE